MSGNKPDLTNPNHTFDNTKDYKRVVFQQGKPVLDVDLNDLSEALETQTVSALVEKMGFGPPQLHYKDWVMGPVNSGDSDSDRNKDNFSISFGRLDTTKGVVDTRLKNSLTTDNCIVYDYQKLVANGVDENTDIAYGNYILKGKITSVDANTDTITDTSKLFTADHRLTSISDTVTIPGVTAPGTNITLTANNSVTRPIFGDFEININEGACRFVNITQGISQNITNFTETTLTLTGVTSFVVGDEYVILPPNSLTSYRSAWNATTNHEASKSEGLDGLPQLLTYVQVFEEDINTVEDETIQSAFGAETTHRTQLRWCVRVAEVKMSIDADSGKSALTNYHLSQYLSAGASGGSDVTRYDEALFLEDTTRAIGPVITEGQKHLRAPIFWRHLTNGTHDETTLGKQESPYSDSYGITPLHFFNRVEDNTDRLFWAFIKAILLQSQTDKTFNDFVPLNIFHSETKPFGYDENSGATFNLSEFFFPNEATQPGSTTHAWLSLSNQHDGTTGLPAKFKSAPRVLHTHADLSMDNMQSRGLFGLDNELLYGTHAPLVFDSVKSHMSFLDQATIGLLGLGSGQGQTLSNKKIPSAVNYTLTSTSTGLADSGYGVGRITPINPLASSSEAAGFLTGGSQYLLRDKGTRTSHEVNHDDAELGWSFYKNEAATLTSNITGSTLSDFSVRGWDEGLAQSTAFLNGLNFRKLAIKTTAHKSQDLFTISERPISTNVEVSTGISQNASGTAFQIPYNQSQANNGNLFIDSYSGSGTDVSGLGVAANFNATNFIPANVTKYDPKNLLSGYQASGGIKDFRHYVEATGTTSDNYGPWNRFNTDTLVGPLASNTTNLFVNDLWSNRCTAMRLRYHVGDFYPGDDDARGVPRNLLVDSMNLFVKVEPLSLAHWMTMPKHQHSILENSISFAEGIEALLKVAHGIGDTQKLINGSNQPLIQANSPALTEAGNYNLRSVGDVDPLNLPFEHYKHPFVHWYHPAMHKIQGPHPDGTNDTYTNSITNATFNLTVYPKWSRRSLIVPALTPSNFRGVTYTRADNSDYQVPYTATTPAGGSATAAVPTLVGTDTEASLQEGLQLDISTTTSAYSIDDKSILPYVYHGSKPSNSTGTKSYTDDNGNTLDFRHNQITFPAVGTHGDELRPGPVFLPASRVHASQVGSTTEVKVGFNTLLTSDAPTRWNDIDTLESSFPYKERDLINAVEAGTVSELPLEFMSNFTEWSTPVLRTAINTQTVAGIVQLVRTKFRTGLDSSSLPSHYTEFTLPGTAFDNYASGDYTPNQIPAVGPDNPLDTLFVGDLGTSLGFNSNRTGFMSPLNLGVPMRVGSGLMPNDMAGGTLDVRDSWELAYAKYNSISDDVILNSFTAIQNMGLQQKLMWNCSFRVLHARPSGSAASVISSAPKSITEVFLAHDRREGAMIKKTFETPTGGFDKPFIHLMSMHPYTNNSFPNKPYSDHLYSMVSDSTGGTHDSTAYTVTNNGDFEYDYTDALVKTSSMGDTYAADPFDTAINSRLIPQDNPVRAFDNLNANSGIEIDLLSELGTIHTTAASYNLSTDVTISDNSDTFTLLDTMPSANELTLPGDHELIFVLYTGHYGAKQHESNNEVDISYIPPVAGCHLTATLEINRPSERTDSGASNIHYGKTLSGNQPIKTHAILSTK